MTVLNNGQTISNELCVEKIGNIQQYMEQISLIHCQMAHIWKLKNVVEQTAFLNIGIGNVNGQKWLESGFGEAEKKHILFVGIRSGYLQVPSN